MSRDAAKKTFREIEIGAVAAIERTFSAEDVDRFAELSGDFSPLHVDEEYAKTTEFGRRVVHGMLLASQFSHLVGMKMPGQHALYLGQDLAFRRPVLVGDRITATAKVTGKNAATRTILLATEIRNAEDKVVVSGSAKVKVRDDEPIEDGAAPQAAVVQSDTRVAIVTGASRGIGAAIARTLAARGVSVGVNYFRSADQANALVEEIRAAGGNAIAVQADVRNADELAAMFGAVVEAFGGLDLLVNGAVGELQQRPFADLTWDDFLEPLDVQVKAAVLACQHAYPHMKARGGGAVVNLLSQVTSGTAPSQMADYVVAKYALLGLSRALAAEWASSKIRVNTVSPGLVQTELTQHYNERIFKMEAARTPLRRLCTPQDVANAVAYLLGDEASFLTGTDISLTGGQVAK